MAKDEPRFRRWTRRCGSPSSRRVLRFWDEADVFGAPSRSARRAGVGLLRRTADGERPAAHRPRLTRTFKDVYPRYRTMTGHLVHRKAGWDCHGLPVEIEVEKEIGTSGKRDIEAFGVAEFNERCRESVRRYVKDWEDLTRRIGFWIDMDDAYWTMDPAYVESVWWSLKRLHERGLLVEADKVTAYCPRCGTALSDAEVARVPDGRGPSISVRRSSRRPTPRSSARPCSSGPRPVDPPANIGVAVAPNADYVVAERDGERVLVAERACASMLGEGMETRGTVTGQALAGAYEPPFPNVEGAHRVVAGSFVSLEDGTGIVHMARVRRRGPRRRARAGMAGLQAGRRRRPIHRARPGVRARALRQGRGPADRRGPPRGPLLRSGTIAHVSVLLALLDSSTTRGRPGTSGPPP